jgi:hypothetical protein
VPSTLPATLANSVMEILVLVKPIQPHTKLLGLHFPEL